MTVMRQKAPNSQLSRACVKSTLENIKSTNHHAVLLVPSFALVQRYRKAFAATSLCFGLTVSTFSAWLIDRWALYGDGRTIVSSEQRKLFLCSTLIKHSSAAPQVSLKPSPGTVKMLASMAKNAFSDLIDPPSPTAHSLSESENELCSIMYEYQCLLSQHNLCEITEVMDILSAGNWPIPPIVIEGFDVFSAAEDRFIGKLGEKTDIFVIASGRELPAKEMGRSQELVNLQSKIFNPDPQKPIQPSGALRFLLPSGAYSAARMLSEAISGYIAEDEMSFALSATNPYALFSELSPQFFEKGIGVSVSASKRYSENDFGRVWLTLLTFLFSERFSTFQMSDIMLSQFSGISLQRAYELDAAWRIDRTTDKAQCIKEVSEASEFLAAVFTLLLQGGFLAALDLFEQKAKAQSAWDVTYRAEQLAAISQTKVFFEALSLSDVEVLDALAILEHSSVAFSAEISKTADKLPRVDIMSFETLALQEECSYDCVILCDLDSLHYPIRELDDAQSRLFKKLNIDPGGSALDEARQNFFRVLSVPRKRLVCERVLNGADAQEMYPCVMLEELLDCYRSNLVSLDEVDRHTGIPKKLLPYVSEQGEAMLYQDATLTHIQQEIACRVLLPSSGEIDKRSKELLVLSQEKSADQSKGFSLSPSAIESYLECPYKWFSLRRLRLDELDAGFGSLEMGNFAHHVLRHFYQAFQHQIAKKVTLENLQDAQSLLCEIFDQYLDVQQNIKPTHHPLIALNALEEAEIVTFRKKLVAYLEYEAQFLPRFTPRYFEYDFGKNYSLEYAGNTLHGTIDRIDVNEKGQAVVIDYKGSVSAEYAYNNSSEIPWAQSVDCLNAPLLPHKVQTLLYAQAARRELGLDVVGALYVSYGQKTFVSGAYDQRVLGPSDIPGIKPEACAACESDAGENAATKSFTSVLDEIEGSIASVLTCLSEGFIKPFPRGKNPCGFCPVKACEKRR